MAVASEADLQAAIGKAIIPYSELYAQLATGTNNFQSRDATFLAAIPADCAPSVQAAQAQSRARFASVYGQPEGLRAVLQGLWDGYARTRDLQPTGNFFEALRDDMHARSKSVLARAMTYGSPSAITGTGTGAMKRLTVDKNNYTIESGFPEVKTAKCIADGTSGATRHQEIFQIYGESAGKDALERNGSGMSMSVTCLSARSTADFVPNPSFENVSESGGSLVAGGIIGWTESAIANFQSVTGDYYKDNPGASTSRSLRFLSDGSIYRRMIDCPKLANWNPDLPLYAQIAFKRESSCDGTLSLTIGNVTASVALVAQSGWTVLTFPITTNAWFKNWNKSVPSSTLTNSLVKVELASNTTGDLLIDDLVIGPYTRLADNPGPGSTWVAMIGGATPFLRGDYFTATDTNTGAGIISEWLARIYGEYLPTVTSSPSWAEPT